MAADASEATRRKRSEVTVADVDYAPSAETIERIEHLRGNGLPIVSAYLAVHPGPEGRKMLRSEADSLLHQVRPLANDRKLQHATRLSLREDIARIADLVEGESFKAGSLAIFSCSGAGVFEVIGLPRAVRERITVDEIPATRPMLAVLDEYYRCCAVVVDRETAHAWELYLGEVLDLGALPGARRGIGHAVNERRNDHRLEELEKRHFREVAAGLEELFRRRIYDVLVAGGHEDELPRFLQLLSRPLRDLVVGTFAVDDHSVKPAAAREQAEAILPVGGLGARGPGSVPAGGRELARRRLRRVALVRPARRDVSRLRPRDATRAGRDRRAGGGGHRRRRLDSPRTGRHGTWRSSRGGVAAVRTAACAGGLIGAPRVLESDRYVCTRHSHRLPQLWHQEPRAPDAGGRTALQRLSHPAAVDRRSHAGFLRRGDHLLGPGAR